MDRVAEDQEGLEPLRIGRYTLGPQIGEGGMGTVYEATDARLGRTVALKRVRPRAGRSGPQATARLIREARALAQVEHPNVVSIFDVGHDEAEGGAYIAMALIDGVPFGEWLRSRPTPARIIQAVSQAGRGLAAAHAAGIVHRDVKPSNLLIARDGRAVVVDFGLAVDGEGSSSLVPTTEPTTTSAAELRLTRTGMVLGTPAYMSPEQHYGEPTDARSDQFSLCVVLYEALAGQRPFGGASAAELAHAKESPPPSLPPELGLPSRVSAAIRRGLSRTPEDRFATIEQLIAALQAARRRGPHRGIVVGLASLAVAGAAAWSSPRDEPEMTATESCAVDPQQLDVAGASEAQVFASLRALASPRGRATGADALARLHDFEQDWRAARLALCQANEAVPRDAPASRCLRIADARAVGIVNALGEADQTIVQHVGAAVRQLPDPSSCLATPSDEERPIPVDEQTAEQVGELRVALAAAHGRGAAGDFERASAEAIELLASAREVGFAPVIAETAFIAGSYAIELGNGAQGRALVEEAYFTAKTEHAVQLTVEAAGLLAFVHGVIEGDLDGARQWYQHALAAAGDYARARRELGFVELNFGSTLVVVGHFDEALTHLERAERALTDARRGQALLEARCQVHQVKSAAYLGLGQYDSALSSAERAVRMAEASHGAWPSTTADALSNMANALTRLARVDEAIVAQDRALAIRREFVGSDHATVGEGLVNLASMQLELGRTDAAVDTSREAVEVLAASVGEDHLTTTASRANLGLALLAAGKAAEAIDGLRAAERQLQLVVEDDNPTLLMVRLGIARAARELGRDEAQALYDRVLQDCGRVSAPRDVCDEARASAAH
ncbi:MAG: serine/threonine-protein kinase [Myxococcota bacterium]